jgi:hypothetical protein
MKNVYTKMEHNVLLLLNQKNLEFQNVFQLVARQSPCKSTTNKSKLVMITSGIFL